jgi:hypothetical protein
VTKGSSFSNISSEVVGFLTCLQPKDVCDYDKEWSRPFFAKHACQNCRGIFSEIRKQGIDIWVDHTPGSPALNFAGPPFVAIARKDFLEVFQPEASQAFHFGRVLDSDGNPMERYLTYISEKPIAVRGKPYEKSSFCPKCRRFRYYPIPPPEGEQYVLADDIAGGSIFETNLGDLLLRDKLAARIKGKKWPGIYVGKMPVRSAPIDGLDPFPGDYI